jgi:hypothetical protein
MLASVNTALSDRRVVSLPAGLGVTFHWTNRSGKDGSGSFENVIESELGRGIQGEFFLEWMSGLLERHLGKLGVAGVVAVKRPPPREPSPAEVAIADEESERMEEERRERESKARLRRGWVVVFTERGVRRASRAITHKQARRMVAKLCKGKPRSRPRMLRKPSRREAAKFRTRYRIGKRVRKPKRARRR